MNEIINEIKKGNSYLVVRIRDEKYAIHVNQLVNILELSKITQVPASPDYMIGIINLRGKALPVVDTRLKFAKEATVFTGSTCIIVLNLEIESEEISIGALVDSVEEVAEIENHTIAAPPSLGNAYSSAFITGVAKLNEEFVMILDFVKLFGSSELNTIAEMN